MLQSLFLKDFVIVRELTIDFSSGLTIITGETGAGKSILIDALMLVLGARIDQEYVRVTAEKAEISATFQANNEAIAWFKNNDLTLTDNEIICRRIIYANGKNRSYVNGSPVTAQQLREIANFLIDICGQNTHHSLLNTSIQREILDAYAGANSLANEVARTYLIWKSLESEWQSIQENAERFSEELLDIDTKIRELKSVSFSINEWNELEKEYAILSNATDIYSFGEESLNLLAHQNNYAILPQLSKLRQKLKLLSDIDKDLNSQLENIEITITSLEDIEYFLNRYLQEIDFDPDRFSKVSVRIQAIHALARKYKCPVESLADLLLDLEARADKLRSYTQSGETFFTQVQDAYQTYLKYAQELSQIRSSVVPILGSEVTKQLKSLSFEGASFKVSLLTEDNPMPFGFEKVEFLISGHTGAPLKALSKIASGGELSRISLAIRVVALTEVPTVIFDEVDVGIGGSVAETVGTLLKKLSDHRQVIVITHLPQIACQGNQHFQVSKVKSGQDLLGSVVLLNNDERIEEIARMLGGIEITDITRQHAREFLNKSHN